MQFPPLVFEPLKFLTPGQSIYLVGGAIRDMLLGLPLKDLDFAVSEDPRNIARRFADQHGGSFYVLDEERHAYRVLLSRAGQKTLDLDFIQMRGNSIESDLLERDFTINAMALDLAQPDVIIDPLKGGRDLQQRLLKPVTSTSLSDDPIRAMRAVRYAVNHSLKIDRKTIEEIKNAAALLDNVSFERKRDELFKILSSQHINSAVQLLHRFNIIPKLGLPMRPDVETRGREIEILDDILQLVCKRVDPDKKQSFQLTSLLLKLSRFSNVLKSFYFDPEPSGRSRRDILLFSLLLKQGITREAIAHFALSVDEMDVILKLQQKAAFPENLIHSPEILTERELYRYFLACERCGVDQVFLSLGKTLAALPDANTQKTWLILLDRAEQCLETWFDHPERVHPKPLLSGKDLMFQFDLPPGPFIGELLDGLKEEQAAGVVVTKSDAIEWVESRLIKFR